MLTQQPVREAGPSSELEVLEAIQKRVLWLSTQIVHHANSVRAEEGSKVGGHQASSASVVSLLTALYFHSFRLGDRVAIKPHASPVYHAIQFLLGNLPGERLKQFRAFHGLQAYPSRTKDVDQVDFSTGSVGLGATAPLFAALAQRFLQDHFSPSARARFIALVGDAELDEGNVWEALAEDSLRGLGQVLWIVDLNRQSLDRVIPSGRAQKIQELFRIHDWHVVELKYGRRLRQIFARPGGEKLRRRIDLMSNEEYQCLLRLPQAQLREMLARDDGGADRDLLKLLEPYPDEEMRLLLSDLGGHDLELILEAYAEADRVTDRPAVIVAYTVKGWGLPVAGDPLNHSKLLSVKQMEELQEQLGIRPGEEFSGFAPGSPEALHVEALRNRWRGKSPSAPDAALAPGDIPESLDGAHRGRLSTQQALGNILTSLARLPKVAERIVTTSPDVAVSTNLGGWINRMGVYCHEARTNFFRESGLPLMLNWDQAPGGQHIELGISENNLFLLLGMLGLSRELSGQTLLPVGTIYDTFIGRGLDALTYAAYSESKFIFAGTPSGITLSPEGGAHQSIITPSIG
ncbi:MAG: pyruvate dehydrogenase, partial [Acidobacteria bacterium]|nr:pyruvate dehydrogenase [Acidobacteriota bacterium]